MKNLKKLKLTEFHKMTNPEMKHITGGSDSPYGDCSGNACKDGTYMFPCKISKDPVLGENAGSYAGYCDLGPTSGVCECLKIPEGSPGGSW